MTTTTSTQEARRRRLAEMAEQCWEVYSEDAGAALDGTAPCPRYALLTSEGSPESTYRDNPNLTVHHTREHMGKSAAGQYDEGWCALVMVDLDTGDELGWEVKVEVQAEQEDA